MGNKMGLIWNSGQFINIFIAVQCNLLVTESRSVSEIHFEHRNFIDNIYNQSTDELISGKKSKEVMLKSNFKTDHGNTKHSLKRARRQTNINNTDNTTPFGTCDKLFTCGQNNNKSIANCYCDEHCPHYNDCCDDYDRNIKILGNDINRTKMICRVYIRSDIHRYGRGYWMVKTCPRGFQNVTISNRCMTNRYYNIPVTGKTGKVYDNPFCATCNGEIEYVPWQVRVVINTPPCERNFPLSLISNENAPLLEEFGAIRNSLCEILFDPPLNDNPRICLLPNTQIKQDICDRELATDFGGGKTLRILSLNVLFTLSSTIGGNKKCGSNQEYDQESGLCFIKTCGSDSNICNKREVVSVQNYKMNSNVIFVSNFPLQLAQAREAVFLFMSCIPFKNFGFEITADKIKFFSSFYPIFEMNDTKIHTLINITMDIIVTKVYRVIDISVIRTALEEFGWKYFVRHQNIEIQRIWNVSKYLMSDTFFRRSYLKDEFAYSGELMYNYLRTIDIQDNGFDRNKFPMFCNASIESAMNIPGKTVHLYCYNKRGNVIKSSDLKPNYLPNLKTKQFQAILTYLTLSLSSAAILPTLGIQRYLQLTQTTPGHISENILVVILIFNIFFMVGTGATDYMIFCLLSSVITHYLILSCFLWVSIFVFHTIGTLRGLKKVKRGNKQVKQSFPNIFYAFGYISPLLIIVPSVIADICDCSSIKIGYTTDICFPTAYPANLVVFVGPVIVSVVVNLGGLIFSGWTLCKLNVYLSHKGITNSRSFVGVYIRLTVLSGLSWGVGVISEWLDNDILRFIFIIFTGSHGLMFCLCIVSTKLVRETIKEKWCPRESLEQLEMDKACGTIEDNGNNAFENVSASNET